MGGATCVEVVVLPAGDPGLNPAPSGPILRVIAPSLPPVSCLSQLTCQLKPKTPKKKLHKETSVKQMSPKSSLSSEKKDPMLLI